MLLADALQVADALQARLEGVTRVAERPQHVAVASVRVAPRGRDEAELVAALVVERADARPGPYTYGAGALVA